MAGIGSVNDNSQTHFTLSQHFFAAWQLRNDNRKARWEQEPSCNPFESETHLAALHQKLQHLKAEIASLVAQDTALFNQLFALHEAILDLREQLEASGSECSSGDTSPCSTLSSASSGSSTSTHKKRSSSFVRHHVSYPPTARNRSHRIKSAVPHHGCQGSYDSGIHTSDHEIFV
ncbi:uncharacterized protein [Anabrus simplex]|uniref:uncharacterized protein n=1 Tax=Anabrus simplex TaxID=316456 RepID=UPI0034DD260B